MTPIAEDDAYDLAIIGGGINGTGIARDAAGRGWRVYLCEQGDLASGTSSASTKLIHGGLRYLEQWEFRLVREALQEREVLWGIAPHIVWPLRFVLPHHRGLRPAWKLRLGLFLYDHLGGRRQLLPTSTVRLQHDEAGTLLKPEFTLGFAYSDCWVEDSRLVVLNACDAAARGATIATRTACLSADRQDGGWRLGVRDRRSGTSGTVRARALVNAAGPWIADVAGSVLGGNAATPVRLVKGSHIVVPRLYRHDGCYIFQNRDRRIFFLIPYEQDFTLIGTTDQDYQGDPGAARASAEEIAYLCTSASAYLRRAVTPEMVVWSYSGVRALYDDRSAAAQETSRDYVLKLEAPDGASDAAPDRAAPLLSVYGGKITTYRRLAEAALAKLQPHLPAPHGLPAGWTARTPLPGGDFDRNDFAAQVDAARQRFAFVPQAVLRRLVRAYGTKVPLVLNHASTAADLGDQFGSGLSEVELRYLIGAEWAREVDDVLWRRTRLGLRLSPGQQAAVADAMQKILAGS